MNRPYQQLNKKFFWIETFFKIFESTWSKFTQSVRWSGQRSGCLEEIRWSLSQKCRCLGQTCRWWGQSGRRESQNYQWTRCGTHNLCVRKIIYPVDISHLQNNLTKGRRTIGELSGGIGKRTIFNIMFARKNKYMHFILYRYLHKIKGDLKSFFLSFTDQSLMI